MVKGVSLHIGISSLSAHYLNLGFGDMPSAIEDANNLMVALPNSFRKIAPLINATTYSVKEAITDLAVGANKLTSGDILVITYAGHGGMVFDTNCSEPDCQNETWCLFDKELLDDELLELWSKFDEGVRILVISDSCHSGTIVDFFKTDITKEFELLLTENDFDFGNFERAVLRSKGFEVADFDKELLEKDINLLNTLGYEQSINIDINSFSNLEIIKPQKRTLPKEILKTIYSVNSVDYLDRRKATRINLNKKLLENKSNGYNGLVKASVILLSACQDDQLADIARGGSDGLFTKTLLDVWNSGSFKGNYLQFHQKIWDRIKYTQNPNYYKIGAPNPEFELQIPFTI